MTLHPDSRRFPIGTAIDIHDLERDPYPIYAQLQASEPITWVRALGMWYVTRYADVRTILMDVEHFTTASEHSLIFDTFGAHMLTTEAPQHDRYRSAFQHAFLPLYIRQRIEATIHEAVSRLINSFETLGEVELRSAFASRLPIQTILTVFGIPAEGEPSIRRWYDSFEKALSNFTRDARVRSDAQRNVAELRDFLGEAMAHAGRSDRSDSLLSELVNAPAEHRLTDDEIKRNMFIILFGGISTVEALILNSLWALLNYPDALERVRADYSLAPKVLDETIRWLSPVQSATRHVVREVTFQGVTLAEGAVVNCMLGAANRDPAVFAEPDRFELHRPNARRHLGFAIGPHSCLGVHLAKAQGRIALQQLLSKLPNLRLVGEKSSPPEGYEFRQSPRLHVAWTPGEGS